MPSGSDGDTERIDGVGDLEAAQWIDARASAFEAAMRCGDAPSIEDYLRDAPPDRRTPLLEELILLEVELDTGRAKDAHAYVERFPDHATWITAALRDPAENLKATEVAPSIASGGERAERRSDLPRLGQYQLTSELGKGGMGVVYLGIKCDRVEEHRVAVKMLRGAATGEASERFLSEMATMARLQHPHIVPILDSGRDERAALYFVMPFFSAGDLATALAAQGVLSPQSAAEYGLAIAWALGYLHERGIVHRDLKLRNILLDDYRDGRFPLGRPWLTDFGLVKLLDRQSPEFERDRLTGTILSMSPEQADGRNEQVGPASDIWSLGVLLFELLTGRPPFQGKSVDEVRYQILKREPTPVRSLRRSVPRDLERIVSKCLEKSAEDRYSSTTELIADLSAFLKNEPPPHAPPRRVHERVERWARRKPALSIRWAVIAVLLSNIWINRVAARVGWQNRPKDTAVQWQGFWHTFMEFWFDQLLLLIWAALSFVFQVLVDRGAAVRPIRMIWLATDALIVTAILWNVEALQSPLVIAYAALIVASGLWQDGVLVTLTTALCIGGYLALVCLDSSQGLASPLYEILHVLTTFVALGVLVNYHLRRSRSLERFYRQEPKL